MASPSTEVESQMDVGSQSSRASELNLSLLDEDLFTKYKERVIDRPWAKWTEDDKTKLMDHIKYHTECIEFINKCWATGPTKETPPKKPESCIENIVMKSRKRKSKDSSSTGPKSKSPKVNSFNQMNDDEFNDFLTGLIDCNFNNTTEPTPELNSIDLDSVAEDLINLHEELKKSPVNSSTFPY